MKVIVRVISSTYIFFNHVEIIFFRVFHYTFHQVLFDMSKNEDTISQPVKVKKHINGSFFSGVILEKISLIL